MKHKRFRQKIFFVRCKKIDLYIDNNKNKNYIYLLTPDEDNFLSKAPVFHCSLSFVVQVSTFPFVALFYLANTGCV